MQLIVENDDKSRRWRASAAKEVCDRWHLLCNLRDNVERLL
jgi:hypothetical protein